METALWHGVIRRSVIVLLGRLDEARGLVFPSDACAPRRPLDRPSFDLQKQRDKFALAMCVGLGKDRFQLIARRLP